MTSTIGVAATTPRMRLLLDSAVEVLAERGLRGHTHRAVDAEAGLAEGSCSAYLRTRQSLLTALAAYVVEQMRADIAALAAHVDSEPSLERALVETAQLFRGWLARPNMVLARLELSMAALRSPELAQVLTEQREALVDVVSHLLTRRRPDHAPELADTLIAALDGVLTEAFRKPADERLVFLDRSLTTLIYAVVGDETDPT